MNIKLKNKCHPELVSGSQDYEILKQAEFGTDKVRRVRARVRLWQSHKRTTDRALTNYKTVQGDRTYFYDNNLSTHHPSVSQSSTSPRLGRICGFTLAETLITLVIVGVIAALTVPTLITKYQKEQTVVRLKKGYSTLSQALQKSQMDNGPIATWDTSLSSSDFIDKYILKYLNISKTCPAQGWNSPCLKQYSYNLSGELCASNCYNNYRRAHILSDGIVLFYLDPDAYDHDLIMLYLDINGKKGPNRFGRDIFSFILFLNSHYNGTIYGVINRGSGNLVRFNNEKVKNVLYPDGYGYTREELLSNDYRSCSKTAPVPGHRCTELIINDGWQIKDDYPW